MFKATDVITILGKRGSGKTTLARKIQRCFPRLVIFDRLKEYSGERGPGVRFVSTFSAFARAIKETLDAPSFKIVFQFDVETDSHDEVFNQALYLLYKRDEFATVQTSVCVVIDEVHNFASPHYIPKWLKEALLTGRHQNMGLICCSQRPANVHKDILAQSHHIFCAAITETNDLNYLKAVLGSDVDRLATLRPFHFLHRRDGAPSQVVTN